MVLEKRHLVLFFYAVVMASLILSPFVLSVGMISLAVLSLIRFRIGRGLFELDIDREAIGRMLRLLRYPPFAACTLFFFVLLLPPWPMEDYGYWLGRLRMKLPFIGLPLVFLGHSGLSKRELNGLLYLLLGLLLITAIWIAGYYALNYEAVQVLLKQGQPMPTPRNHIRYSLMLALGILGGAYLYQQAYRWRYAWERHLILVLTLLLFVFLHLLSVRSGLLALYFAMGVLLLRYIALARRYLVGGALLLALFSAPVLAYKLVPSFKAKIDYMQWSMERFEEGQGGDYADPGRIISLQIGWELFRESPWLGVGIGQLEQRVNKRFAESFPTYPKALKPHNQFLFVMASSGLIGLAIFLFAFGYPLFYQRNYRHLPFLGFYCVIFTAFCIEHTIENSIGAGIYVFFLLLLLNHLHRPD